MNLKAPSNTKLEKRFDYQSDFVKIKVAESIHSLLPTNTKDFVIVCIGTDRSTGDALGPLTGSLLKKKKQRNFSIFGTLENPVHAKNLNETLASIHEAFNNPFILAVDACLGQPSSVGSINVGTGALKPGAALNKDLPPIGDLYLTGIVNIGGYMDYMVLQSTRLHIVMSMAEIIADALHYLDIYLNHPTTQTLEKRIKI
ncbi:spore protease YyaC [Paraliobacillus salinarum]|uniref:spore protease YyaC n=1 Tax=Paraliobacillus salinarum TaxID=1158996 RepID=UPI0015F649FA|nr:spore protease YyaC [Paraliobacillus salinarum]